MNQSRLLLIAEKVAQNRERFDGHCSRRALQEEALERARRQQVGKMEAAEARVADQRRDIAESQRRRAFNNAQKRSEQQKVLRDWQKERQQAAVAARSAHDRAVSPEAAPAPKPGGEAEVKAVEMFMTAFAAFSGGEEGARSSKQSSRHRDESGELTGLFEGLPPMAGGTPADGGSTGGSAGPSSPLSASRGTLLLAGARTGDLRKAWQERRHKSQLWADEVAKAQQAKGSRAEKHLLEARERISAHNQAIVKRLRDQADEWTKRSVDATRRRCEAAIAGHDESEQKESAWQERMCTRHTELTGERTRHAAERDRKLRRCQEVSRAVVQGKANTALGHLAKLDAAAVERALLVKAEAEHRRQNDHFAERRDEAAERRVGDRKGRARKVREEAKAKEARSARALHSIAMSALERERERKRDGLRAQDVLAPLGYTPVDEEHILPRLSGTMSLPILARPVGASPIMSPTGRQRADGSGDESASDVSEESSAAGEEEFLGDLEARCGGWLADLRRKKKFAVC